MVWHYVLREISILTKKAIMKKIMFNETYGLQRAATRGCSRIVLN